MKRIKDILLAGALVLLCGCGGDETSYQYARTDVSAACGEAQSLYDSEKYEESLSAFLNAMQEEPKDMAARLGVIRCQIALGNYDVALLDLYSAVSVVPEEEELYDLYLQISDLTNNLSTARTAVDLAKRYGVESFLEKIPAAPVLGEQGGEYDHRLEVAVTTADADAEIYISVVKESDYHYNDIKYSQPWIMTTGETKLTAYCVKDGMPSETVEAAYLCEYEPTVVQFADPMMEQLVRNTIGKPEGEITDVDCESINSLTSYELRTDEMEYEEYQKMKIKSLDDLRYMPNLTYLSLQEQEEIEDYSKLKLCPRLNDLQLYRDEIKDISFISELENLNYLYLDNNQIVDLQPVFQCEDLGYLSIQDNPVDDCSGLADLENLYGLHFDTDQPINLELLQQCEGLTNLAIDFTGEDDISYVGQLTQLTSLNIESDLWNADYDEREKFAIRDISYVGNLKNLTYLNLDGLYDLSRIDCLKELTNLQDLYLYNRYESNAGEDEAAIRELQRALPQCNISY